MNFLESKPSYPLKILLEGLVKLIFLLTAGFFARQIIEEYLEGKTYFSFSKQPLKAEDLPIFTICFLGTRRLQYGLNIKITTFTRHTNSTYTLLVGKNEIYSHVIYLEKLILQPSENFTDCFTLKYEMTDPYYKEKIQKYPLWDRVLPLDFMKIHLAKDSGKDKVSEIKMFITSRQNSYGAVIYQWFDGLADPFKIKRKKFYSIHITQVRRYEYTQGTCSQRSFFECVASELRSLKKCQQDRSACSPVSLPSNATICNDYSKKRCWKDITEIAFPKCMTKKSCNVEEYNRREERSFLFKPRS